MLSTARKKVLQSGTLTRMRAMRSIIGGACKDIVLAAATHRMRLLQSRLERVYSRG